ncbi:MAG: hypothetical protein ACR2P7_09150, partial [bacterium]
LICNDPNNARATADALMRESSDESTDESSRASSRLESMRAKPNAQVDDDELARAVATMDATLT